MLEKQGQKAGNYTKQDDQKLGMPYWINSEATMAIWFEGSTWKMSYSSNLGTGTSGIHSKSASSCPESDGIEWMYRNSDAKKWLDAGSDAKVTPNLGKWEAY